MESDMRKIVLAAAALAIASPALGQSYDPALGSGNIVGNQPVPQSVYQGPEGAFARVTPGTTRRRAPNGVYQAPNTVHDDYGHVIGADPDPNIRLQLHRDADSIGGF
jgi:hypothetical protein